MINRRIERAIGGNEIGVVIVHKLDPKRLVAGKLRHERVAQDMGVNINNHRRLLET
jgi:hypothetical protein